MTGMTDMTELRELDARSGDGVDVRLLWNPADDTTIVSVLDLTKGQAFELVVDRAEALDAFHHPFAYASFRGIAFAARLRAHEEEPVAAS